MVLWFVLDFIERQCTADLFMIRLGLDWTCRLKNCFHHIVMTLIKTGINNISVNLEGSKGCTGKMN